MYREQQAIVNLKKLKKVTDKLGIDIFLLYGTALGLARDGELIVGDHDVDVGIIDPGYENIKGLIDMIDEAGFGYYISNFWNWITDTNYVGVIRCGWNGVSSWNPDDHLGITIDFHIYYKRPDGADDDYWWIKYASNKKLLGEKIPNSMINNQDRIKVKGIYFNTPGPIGDYLTYVYDDGWKIPKEGTGNIPLEFFDDGVSLDPLHDIDGK